MKFDELHDGLVGSALEIREKAVLELVSQGGCIDHIKIGIMDNHYAVLDVVRRRGYRFETEYSQDGQSMKFVAVPFTVGDVKLER